MFSTPFTFLKATSAGYDPDAQAFFDAIGASGGSLSTDDKNRINTLTLDLKSNSLWNDLHAFYPYIGGDAITTSFNLIDPSQYRITWYDNPIFETYGVRGTNTGADNAGARGLTNFYPSRDFSVDQYGIGSYVVSTIAEADGGEHYIMGSNSIGSPPDKPRVALGQIVANTARARAGENGLIDFAMPANNGQGLWHVTRDGSTTTNGYFNGSNVGSETSTVTFFDDGFQIMVLALALYSNTPTGQYRPTRKVLGFSFIDKGMDSTQASAMKTVADTYMSGR